ncbi:putative extracellular nuclease [Deinococcus peraridilitoris DSM 19664]|uniref:Putative extracellular nuclease n=1 Tax=Deinococcus peraridilitoris (strain DSM 19664 / LMG 22246 / CIP 109416 / KR-200) TaxID=937777 RepID=L0A5D5_DEIPD|nr:putative extracellular nuclease [Deinococcus peraridilitoris DSM 19664]
MVGVFEKLGGFFVQDYLGDGNRATSDGIFVFGKQAVKAGDFVKLSGTVSEFKGANQTDSQTQIDKVSNLEVCASGYWVQSTKINLPVASRAQLEAFEGMAVHFEQTLTVTEVFALGRFGELSLSADGRLFNPTNGNTESTLEQNKLRRIILDDGSTASNPVPTPYLSDPSSSGTRRVGDTVKKLSGILSFAFDQYRIQPTAEPQFVNANKRTARPKDVGGSLKVASFNVLNYFTDFGQRGANNAAEFERQQAKIVAAITAIDADVLGLIEMQNNGDVALQNLVAALNAAYGSEIYRALLTGTLGTDAIKQAIIYKPGKVNLIGRYKTDSSSVLDRPTLAQTFQHVGGHGVFTVAVNHFKSKGCGTASGENADLGQGCWNAKRVQQAQALVEFAEKLRAESGDTDVLMIGDLNAYGAEDPIRTLQGAGFESLNLRVPAEERYSYVFDGQSGYLDHALSTASLSPQVSGITEWHINSDEPIVLDYNLEFKTDDRFAATPYRSSDHDPVVVGLQLNADPLRAAQPYVSVTAPVRAQAGQDVELQVAAEPGRGSSLQSLEINWGDGQIDTLQSGTTSAVHVYASAGTYNITATASDVSGAVSSHSATITVSPAPSSNDGKVVISQVYGGGGNSGATLKNDFIELHNLGSTPVSLEGWSVQYASASGSTWQKTNLGGIVAPGGYYLIQQAAGAGGTESLPAADATGSIAMAASAGKVALVKTTTALTCGATCAGDANVADFVGYGASNNFLGAAPAPALSATASALRKAGRCQNTPDNGADFATFTPAVASTFNSASPANTCP